jgi:hypothetical protein
VPHKVCRGRLQQKTPFYLYNGGFTLKPEDFVKGKLVELGWRFGTSYNSGHLAGVMVMQVLSNRQRAGFGSYLSIIENVPNFMAENEIPPMKLGSVWDPLFTKLLHAIEGIYDGSAQDLTKGALYFGDLNKIESSWFKSKVLDAIDPATGLRRHPIVSNMGPLSFFK